MAMIEREIFDAALEVADPLARRAFIEMACADDPTMLASIKSLLKSHDSAGSFLDLPAAEQMQNETALASGVMSNLDDSTTADEKKRRFHPGLLDGDADDDSQPDLSFLQPSSKPGLIGVLAHYEVLNVLGLGAFGIVFKAFDEKLHRLVAIKVMNPQLAATSPARKRFLREARAAAAIRHENVVQVYSVEEQPLPYLVMELIDGQTLKQKLDGHGPLELAAVLHIGRQIASGLAAAHGMGLIHRDIKPANILIEQPVAELAVAELAVAAIARVRADGAPARTLANAATSDLRIKISDFGLARAVDDASMTSTGVISGTPMYMAPEQAQGQMLDHRTDLFSFGSVLYQMCCGGPPFRAATTVAVLHQVVEETPRPLPETLPDIPDWLVAIVTKLHAKKPEDRFQSAKEVADLLARCQSELQFNGDVTCVVVPPNVGHVSNVPAPKPAETEPVTKPLAPSPNPEHVEHVLHETRRRLLLIAAALIGIAILAGIIKPWQNNNTVTEHSISKFEISNLKSQNSDASSWRGWPADAPPPAIAPFKAEQARQHQEAWAEYLGVPVEYTNSLDMKFRLIPPGEFVMGSTTEEIEQALMEIVAADTHWRNCVKAEAPRHRVVLTKPIYLGVHEVTQAEYLPLMGQNPAHFASTGMGKEAVAGLRTTGHPVESVTWFDAAEFCVNLSTREKLNPVYVRNGDEISLIKGTGYRLPTEAEWDFACRAGTTTKYWIGDMDEDLVLVGWFDKNSRMRTHAVGELKPNPFGLFDVHGNVWEWVQDGWDATSYGQFQETPAINPSSPFLSSPLRVIRGGYWELAASYCRTSDRLAREPTRRIANIGFRVSLPVDAVRQAWTSR